MINPIKWLEKKCFYVNRMYLYETCRNACWDYFDGTCKATLEERKKCEEIEMLKREFRYKTSETFFKNERMKDWGEIVILNGLQTLAFVLNFNFEKYKKKWKCELLTHEQWKNRKKWTYEPVFIRWALKLIPNAEIWLSNEDKAVPLIIKNDVGAFLIAPLEID